MMHVTSRFYRIIKERRMSLAKKYRNINDYVTLQNKKRVIQQ